MVERGGKVRRTPEDMDQVRAQMMRDGYPLPGSQRGNETVWKSLAGGIRRPQLLALLGMTPESFEERLREVRQQRKQLMGRA